MSPDVRHRPDLSRYELWRGDDLIGVADYRLAVDNVVITHTVIVPHLRGQGYGDQLVKGVLDDIRPTGRGVVPQCWFVAEYIDLHPEYRELLTA